MAAPDGAEEVQLSLAESMLRLGADELEMQTLRLSVSEVRKVGSRVGDAHFYLVAARLIQRGLCVAEKAGLVAAAEALEQLHSLPEFKLMRDIFEHVEEYGLGIGREQKRGKVASFDDRVVVWLRDEGHDAPVIEMAGRRLVIDHLTPALIGITTRVRGAIAIRFGDVGGLPRPRP